MARRSLKPELDEYVFNAAVDEAQATMATLKPPRATLKMLGKSVLADAVPTLGVKRKIEMKSQQRGADASLC